MTIDPRTFASTPFKNKNAFLDLTGQLQQLHVAIAETVGRNFGVTYPLYPIGTAGASTTDWLQALQAQCGAAAAALGIPQPPDLGSYDLSDEGDFASWAFQVGEFHRALALAAGLP